MSNAVTVIIDDTALLDQPPDEASVGDPGGWYVTESDSLEGGFLSNYNNTNFIPDFKPFGEGPWTFGFDGRCPIFSFVVTILTGYYRYLRGAVRNYTTLTIQPNDWPRQHCVQSRQYH